MRIAVISDIHGNSAALDAVMDDIARRGADRVVNLGDTISGPLDPAGTADRLMAAEMPTIAGNHDRWLYDPPEGRPPLWEAWTVPKIEPRHVDWIRSLPPLIVVEGILLSHGTPQSDHENWLHQRDTEGGLREAYLWEAEAPARGHDHPVILSGHTHVARIVRLGDGRLLVNPGAVGCPAYLDDRYDPPFVAEAGAPDARYAVLERIAGAWHASLHAVPYDPRDMIARAEALGAEGWLEALSTGWMRPHPSDHAEP